MNQIDYVLIDITEELCLLKNIITNPLDIQNVLMDLFICINENNTATLINFDVLLESNLYCKKCNINDAKELTVLGNALLDTLKIIKNNLIKKLFDYKIDNKTTSFYFKSLHSNRVVLQQLLD